MVSTLKNLQGYIYGFAEWYVLNDKGHFQEDGDYIYIHEIWIHENKRRSKALKHLIHKIDTHECSHRARHVYWNNEKHDRLTKSFKRERLAKIGV